MKLFNNEFKKIYTEKELKALLLNKLNSMHSDINSLPENAKYYLTELRKTRNDKLRALMDLYSRDYAPAKVTDFSGMPKKQGDMTGEMIDFSNGFDSYIDSLEKEYMAAKKKRGDAIRLLTLLLSLKQPYSRILYLRYYKRLSPEQARFEMNISRSTLFRKQNAALDELVELYAENFGIVLIQEK